MTTRDMPDRCGAMGGKVVFTSKDAARDALPAFRADHNGHGKVIKCFPLDHWHLTKGRTGRKGKSLRRNRTERIR